MVGGMSLMGVHRGMMGLGLWRGAQWGEGMGIWGVVRGWVYRGSMVGETCGVEQSGSGSSVGCQGVGRLCGVQQGWVPGEEKALDIGPGRGGAGDLSQGEVDSVTGDQSWGRAKKRCCRKEAHLHNYKPEG